MVQATSGVCANIGAVIVPEEIVLKKKKEHPELCLCNRCSKRLLAKNDKYLKAWLERMEKRVDQLERDTSPHALAGYID